MEGGWERGAVGGGKERERDREREKGQTATK